MVGLMATRVNIYGETVNITPAQYKMLAYINHRGWLAVSRFDKREWKTAKCLKDKGLIMVKWADANYVEYKRV
jgi:hypothetical protein